MKHGHLLRASRPLLALIGLMTAAAAQAERLDIDHRLYAPLHAAMEQPHEGSIFYQASPSGRQFDRILVNGTSAEHDWTEALELVVVPRKGERKPPQEWFAAFQAASESTCPANVTVLGEDESSITFSLDAPPCSTGTPLSGLYRVIYGRKTVYVVSAKLKGQMPADQRQQWLGLLNSAKLAG
ncbi:hypothetical protein H7F50_02730 [Novosphingobium flavum]|uniref:hypothetical protein n=1 Tax=Novosphingobium aerophilum TaxID=2839843 RepID=UPI00163A80D0|nr:hypothetical protein [Novosphingobium aerophilum]MBC2660652.1 hypothetical protein [Novosphingobium aerophilum]